MQATRLSRTYAIATLAAIAAAGTLRAEKPFDNPDPAHYLFEDAIKPGMKGYGLTCISGGKIEKFDIEVIDVMKNYAPGSNAILVKCAGLNLEHSGVIAGMSGSPCYIDGKMIGAIAFDWPLGKDPIAGVQPIRQMLSIPTDLKPDDGKSATSAARWRSNQGVAAMGAKLPGYSALIKSVGARQPARRDAVWLTNSAAKSVPTLQPIASPIMISGASTSAMTFLRQALANTPLVPVASGAAGGSTSVDKQIGGAALIKPGEIKLEPGSSIAIPLVSGDMDISAIGTVTEVRDKKIYAFGHAMFADGATSLPISTGYIYTIMPNLQQSFKMGSSFEPMGALITDEHTGIVGMLGEKPRTIPISLHVHSGDGAVDRTFHYQLTQHARITPIMLGTILTETITAQRAMPKQYTARITGDIKFESTTLQLDLLGTSQGFRLSEAILPVALLTDNPFKNLKIDSINLDAKIEPVDRSIGIKSVTAQKLIVAPGDDVTATVELEPFHQPAKKVAISINVPKDTPDGTYDLYVGGADGIVAQEAMTFPHRFEPENIETLVDALKNILAYRKDKIYARLILDVTGAAQKGREFSNIPPSKMALYASEKLANTSPVHNAVTTSIDAAGVVDGGDILQITVNKNANQRFFKEKSNPLGDRPPLPQTGPKLGNQGEEPPPDKSGEDQPFGE